MTKFEKLLNIIETLVLARLLECKKPSNELIALENAMEFIKELRKDELRK